MKSHRASPRALALAAVPLFVAHLSFAQTGGAPVHEHATKAPAHRRAPPLAVDAAFAPDGRLWLVALDEHGRLALLQSRDEGKSWSPPRALETGADRISATGENRPRLAFGPQGRVAIVYAYEYAQATKRHSGEIRLLASADGGRTFAPPLTIHQDRQVIAHSFPSAMFDAKGALHTFWIDKRDAEATAAPARYAGSAIYRNVSLDGGRTFGADTKVADHACECCRIALAPEPSGGLVALWRHVYEGGARDHAFVRVAGAASTPPVRATFDDWKIEACPHHGPGLAPAENGGYHAVWFGSRDGRMAVRYGHIAADGAPDGAVRELPDENAEHADVQSAGRNVVIAWRSFDGTAMALRALVSGDGGATFESREIATSSDDTDYPKLVRRDDAIYLVWRTTREIRVERMTP